MNDAATRRPGPAPRRAPRGFTLIELMITVAVIAILAAIAMPSYQDYIRKSRRADTQGFLSDVVARQQHFLLDRRSFATSITDAAADNGLNMTIPTSVSSFYTVTIATDNAARPPAFTVTATPIGGQAADKCGKLFIDQAGAKKAENAGSCW